MRQQFWRCLLGAVFLLCGRQAAEAETILLKITGEKGFQLTITQKDPTHLTIRTKSAEGEENISGDLSDHVKHKWTSKSGGYKVKTKDPAEGFKVEKLSDDTLLWKVKFKDDKIKISNNEENTNPFILKKKDENRLEVSTDSTDIGKVTNSNGTITVQREALVQFESQAPKLSYAFGTLLLAEIPAAERAVIVAELYYRGQ